MFAVEVEIYSKVRKNSNARNCLLAMIVTPIRLITVVKRAEFMAAMRVDLHIFHSLLHEIGLGECDPRIHRNSCRAPERKPKSVEAG